jgi:uncharacterized membrane protein HdeD (DUF308 family)
MHRAVDVDLLVRNGWALALRGLCASVFGACVLLAHGLPMPALVIAYGMYSVVDGIFAFFVALQRRGPSESPRWAYLVLGLSGIALGLALLLWNGMTITQLVNLVGGSAAVSGLAQLVASLRLRQQVRGEWVLAAGGLVAVAFGISAVVLSVGSPTLARWIGGYRLVDGALLGALSLRLRSWERRARYTAVALPEPVGAGALEPALETSAEPTVKIEVDVEIVPERSVQALPTPPVASPSAE